MKKSELSTPCFVFNKKVLSDRMTDLEKIKAEILGEKNDKVKLCYAIKANTFLINAMDENVPAFEVCSWGELNVCKESGIDMSKIVLSGVNKEEAYVADGIKNGVGIITAESKLHYDYICRQADLLEKQVKVILRLSNGAQFGMDRTVLKDIISQRDNQKNVEIIGIHYFTGTAKKKIEKLKKELILSATLIAELKDEFGFETKLLEYGPGLAVPYFTDDSFDNQYDLYKELISFIKDEDYSFEVTLEMGRFFAAACGEYITSVADVKINDGVNVCIIDGGKNQLSYYGQNMALKTPIIQKQGCDKDNKNLPEDTTKWMLFGSLCSFNDIIARDVPIENLQVGDRLIFKETGAYSVTEGIALFLTRDLPSVYVTEDGTDYKLVREPLKTSQFNYSSQLID